MYRRTALVYGAALAIVDQARLRRSCEFHRTEILKPVRNKRTSNEQYPKVRSVATFSKPDLMT